MLFDFAIKWFDANWVMTRRVRELLMGWGRKQGHGKFFGSMEVGSFMFNVENKERAEYPGL